MKYRFFTDPFAFRQRTWCDLAWRDGNVKNIAFATQDAITAIVPLHRSPDSDTSIRP